MPLDFPLSPAPNQVYSLGGKSWKWNGDAWETYNDNLGVDFVETVNGATGDIGVIGGTDISVSTAGKILTINYTGSGGGGGGSSGVTSFNGITGAVQGVSAVNGFTGGFEILPGRGITYSYSNNGISFEINFARGAGLFPGKSAGGMAYTDIMLFQEKPSGGATGAMYTANIQNFYDRFIAPNIPPKPSAAELTQSPSNSFLMVSLAGNEGYVPFSDQMTIISQNLTIVDGGTYT